MVKQWTKARSAEEDWVRDVCVRDITQVEDAISLLYYIVVDDSRPELAIGPQVKALKQFTSTEILDALLRYREQSKNSLEAAGFSYQRTGAVPIS